MIVFLFLFFICSLKTYIKPAITLLDVPIPNLSNTLTAITFDNFATPKVLPEKKKNNF